MKYIVSALFIISTSFAISSSKIYAASAAGSVSQLIIDSTYTTDHLLESGIEGFTGECLDYCITGICSRLVIKLTSVKVLFTPEVRHNVPDFVVNTFDESGEEPWKEWRLTVGNAEKEVLDVVIELITPFEISGGKINSPEHKESSDEGDERFKEVDVIGHPMTYFNNILAGKNGHMTAVEAYAACVVVQSQRNCDAWFQQQFGMSFEDLMNRGKDLGSISEVFEGFGDFDFKNAFLDNKQIFDALGIKDAYEKMRQLAKLQKTLEKVEDVQDLLNGYGFGMEVAIDHTFCPTKVEGFVPYYSSQLDGFWWRGFSLGSLTNGAIPIPIQVGADLPYIDKFVTCSIVALNGKCIVGKDETSMWGTIYPRTGFVIHPNDYKASAVMATRAIDIVTDKDPRAFLRIRQPIEESRGRSGLWQRIHPNTDQCQDSLYARKKGYAAIYLNDSNPLNTTSDKDSHDYGNHAWAYWRSYSCCLSDRGSKIYTINISDVCLNDF